MSRKRLFAALGSLMIILSAGCAVNCISGEGNLKTEQRQVKESFDKISLAGSADVSINYSNAYTIRVEDYENIIDLLETTVEDGTLKITYGKNCINHSKAKVFITMPKIKSIKVTGSGEIKILGNFKPVDYFVASLAGSGDVFVNNDFADSISVSIAGSGDAKVINDSVSYISVSISGSGDALVEGKHAQEAKYNIAGSGYINALNLQAKAVSASISGSGTCKVNATEQLKARVAGSGDIFYKGNPREIDIKTSGSGNITMIK